MPLPPKRDRPSRELDPQTTAAKDSPWGGLRSRYLASLDPAEQVRIFDLSARTSQTLHRWAARYPLIRRVRVWPLSLSVAAGAPFTSVDALISTARLSLWVFTLDDLFDEERVPQVELIKRAERYRALAHNEIPCPSGDSLATALCELRDDLAGYTLFGSLGLEWANALCGSIDAGAPRSSRRDGADRFDVHSAGQRPAELSEGSRRGQDQRARHPLTRAS